jgi:hypothetical protein
MAFTFLRWTQVPDGNLTEVYTLPVPSLRRPWRSEGGLPHQKHNCCSSKLDSPEALKQNEKCPYAHFQLVMVK